MTRTQEKQEITKTLSAWNNSGELMPYWKVKAIEQTGLPKRVDFVAKALQNKIRVRDDREVRRELILLIPTLAKAWGARFDLNEIILTEAIRIIVNKYNFLAVDEIREAYRQWGTGEIEVKGADQYGGEFSCRSMTKILSAYCNERRKIAAEIIKQQTEATEAAEAAEKKEAQRMQFEKDLPKLLEAGRAKYKTWQDVPSFWFRPAYKNGWIKFEEGEAEAIRKQAEDLAKMEMKTEGKAKERSKKTESAKAVVNKWMNRNPEEEAKVKRIARKISVFRKLIQPV